MKKFLFPTGLIFLALGAMAAESTGIYEIMAWVLAVVGVVLLIISEGGKLDQNQKLKGERSRVQYF